MTELIDRRAGQGPGRVVRGLLGAKLGMTQVWDADNRLVPVTVVQAGPCVVTQVRTAEHDGYAAVQLAFGAIDPRKVTKPLAGHFAKAGRDAPAPPRRGAHRGRGRLRARSGADRARPSRPVSWSTSSAPPRARAPPG